MFLAKRGILATFITAFFAVFSAVSQAADTQGVYSYVQRSLNGEGLHIENLENRVVISIPAEKLFERMSCTTVDGLQGVADTIHNTLAGVSNAGVEVRGYSNYADFGKYDQGMSQCRAAAFKKALKSAGSDQAIFALGMGSTGKHLSKKAKNNPPRVDVIVKTLPATEIKQNLVSSL